VTKALHEYELTHQKIAAETNNVNQTNNNNSNQQKVSNQNNQKLIKEPSQEKELNDYVLIFKKSSKEATATTPLPVANNNNNSNEGIYSPLKISFDSLLKIAFA
jgi:hypothetical protein